MSMLRLMLGEDFNKAMKQWLYPTEPMQGLLRSILLAVPLFAFFAVLQSVFGIIADVVVYHADINSFKSITEAAKTATDLSDPQMANFVKAMLIGMFPAAVITAFLTVAASHLGLPKLKGTLPLHWPKIGALGWLVILFVFMTAVYGISIGLFAVMGINPETYGSGMVEKALTDLAADPALFFLALPGAVLGAPLVEEVLFRGVLFAGLLPRLGPVLTVIVTSALWAVAHLGAAPPIAALTIFFMGIVLGYLLLRFGSLWVTIGCHTAWNLMVTLALFSVGSGS
ncbi:MAG: CPBP family intramembrane glutamic endopeptidase [Aestuariivirga sp.]